MRGHNICVYAELTKIIPNYYQIFLLYLELWAIYYQWNSSFMHLAFHLLTDMLLVIIILYLTVRCLNNKTVVPIKDDINTP